MARGLWIAKNMNDLPEVYREGMPAETDPAKLMAAEQSIREAYRKDLKLHAPFHAGYMAVNPDGSLRGAQATDVRAQLGAAQAAADLAAAGVQKNIPAQDVPDDVDLSKLTTNEKLALGLSKSKPARATLTNGEFVTTQQRSAPVSRSVAAFTTVNPSMSTNDKLLAGLSASRPAQRR